MNLDPPMCFLFSSLFVLPARLNGCHSIMIQFEKATSLNQDLCPWADKIEDTAALQAVNMFHESACEFKDDPIFQADGITGSFCEDCITTGNRRR